MPLLLVASILPDIDLLLEHASFGFFMHRGPTHSIITITVLMIPFFIYYRKQAIPYYVALLSHVLIGDIFTGGIELFWPISQMWVSYLNVNVTDLANVITELSLFFVTVPIMYKTGDLQRVIEPNKYSWVLLISLGAVAGPLLETLSGSEGLPAMLVVPSVFWIIIFAYGLLMKLRQILGKPPNPQT